MFSGYGIAFDAEGELSFGNYLAKNVIVFRVHNSLSSHTDNLKNDFLISGEGPAFRNNEDLVHQKKNWY